MATEGFDKCNTCNHHTYTPCEGKSTQCVYLPKIPTSEPTSDLQGFVIWHTQLGEYYYMVCTDCKAAVESWDEPVKLHEAIAAAEEHKRMDLERKWVKTDG